MGILSCGGQSPFQQEKCFLACPEDFADLGVEPHEQVKKVICSNGTGQKKMEKISAILVVAVAAEEVDQHRAKNAALAQ
jgi:hypothetical protein